jgi:hypothetical protein
MTNQQCTLTLNKDPLDVLGPDLGGPVLEHLSVLAFGCERL